MADGDFAPTSMRNATAYGVSPRLRLDVVLNNLVAWAHTTGRVRLASDGTAWRPLVHIRDIARATVALLDASPGTAAGRAFNIGSDEQNYRIRDLAEVVRERLPSSVVELADGASPDARSYRVDFRRFSAAFPTFRCEWSAASGADELATAYEEAGLTRERLRVVAFLPARPAEGAARGRLARRSAALARPGGAAGRRRHAVRIVDGAAARSLRPRPCFAETRPRRSLRRPVPPGRSRATSDRGPTWFAARRLASRCRTSGRSSEPRPPASGAWGAEWR